MSDAPTTDPSNDPDHIKNLRARAEAADAAEQRALLAEKRAAFLEAGVKLDGKPAQALLAQYQGDLTAEAIRAEAQDWGLIGDTATPAAPETNVDDAAIQHQQIREQLHGGPAPAQEAPSKPAQQAAMDEFVKNRKAGMRSEQAEALAFDHVIGAAVRGDKSAIFDPGEWEKQQAAAGHGSQYAR